MRFIDLTGKKFGRLNIISLAYSIPKRKYWNCLCDCGTKKVIYGDSITTGKTKSCGCIAKELLIKRSLKHGYTINYHEQKEYKSWMGAKSRCHNKNDNRYKNYGDRGIIVCDKWINDFSSFSVKYMCPV